MFFYFSLLRDAHSLHSRERSSDGSFQQGHFIAFIPSSETPLVNVCQCKLEETIDVDATISEVSRTRTFKTLILISPVVFPQGENSCKDLAKDSSPS